MAVNTFCDHFKCTPAKKGKLSLYPFIKLICLSYLFSSVSWRLKRGVLKFLWATFTVYDVVLNFLSFDIPVSKPRAKQKKSLFQQPIMSGSLMLKNAPNWMYAQFQHPTRPFSLNLCYPFPKIKKGTGWRYFHFRVNAAVHIYLGGSIWGTICGVNCLYSETWQSCCRWREEQSFA